MTILLPSPAGYNVVAEGSSIVSSHLPADGRALSRVISAYLTLKANGAPHHEAIRPLLGELRYLRREIDFCQKVQDHVRLFWNHIATPGGPEEDTFKWPELEDLVGYHEELAEALSSEIAARLSVVNRLKTGAGTPESLGANMSDCSLKYEALQTSFSELTKFFLSSLPNPDSDGKAWLRFYYFLGAQIDAVQSRCSDVHGALNSLTGALIDLMDGP